MAFEGYCMAKSRFRELFPKNPYFCTMERYRTVEHPTERRRTPCEEHLANKDFFYFFNFAECEELLEFLTIATTKQNIVVYIPAKCCVEFAFFVRAIAHCIFLFLRHSRHTTCSEEYAGLRRNGTATSSVQSCQVEAKDRFFHIGLFKKANQINGEIDDILPMIKYSTFASSMLVIMSVASRQKSRKSFQIFQYLSV